MTIYYQTIEAYAAAISALDPDAFAACFAADCELNDPAGSPTVRVGGTRAAFKWTIEAEGKQSQLGTAEGIDVLEFNEAGQIVRTYAFWNPGPLVAALTA